MPIWGQLELLCKAITEAGEKEAEDVLLRARTEAERIIADSRRLAEQQYDGELASRRSQAYGEARRLVDSAELESRRNLMAFRERLTGEVLKMVEERLMRFRSDPSYGDFLLKCLREGVEHLPGSHFVVEVRKEDVVRLQDGMSDLAGELSVTFEVRTTVSLDGGVRIVTADRHQAYDNSLAARLRRMELEIRQEIWRAIFGTAGSEI